MEEAAFRKKSTALKKRPRGAGHDCGSWKGRPMGRERQREEIVIEMNRVIPLCRTFFFQR